MLRKTLKSDAGSESLPETQGSEALGKDALLREAAAATWEAHVHRAQGQGWRRALPFLSSPVSVRSGKQPTQVGQRDSSTPAGPGARMCAAVCDTPPGVRRSSVSGNVDGKGASLHLK